MTEKLGLNIIYFFGLTTFFMFIANVYMRLPLNIPTLLLLSLLTILMLFRANSFLLHKTKNGFGPTAYLLIGLITATLGLSLILNWYFKPYFFDTLTMYDFRGKVFFINQNIQDINNMYHASYPLFTSLAHTYFYTLGFSNPKFFYAIIFLAIALTYYGYISRRLNRLRALLGTGLLITTPVVFYFSHIAYTNIVYLATLGISFLYLAEYIYKPSRFLASQTGLLLGLAAWTRPATLPFFISSLILVLLFSLRSKRKADIFSFSLPFIVISGSWLLYQKLILAVPTYESVNLLQLSQVNLLSLIFESLPLVFLNLANYFAPNLSTFSSGATGVFIFVAIMAQLFINWKKAVNSNAVVLLLQLATWIGLAIIIRLQYTDINTWLTILADSMQRLFIIFYPLLIYYGLSLPAVKKLIK
jgi:hypothetical protein